MKTPIQDESISRDPPPLNPCPQTPTASRAITAGSSIQTSSGGLESIMLPIVMESRSIRPRFQLRPRENSKKKRQHEEETMECDLMFQLDSRSSRPTKTIRPSKSNANKKAKDFLEIEEKIPIFTTRRLSKNENLIIPTFHLAPSCY
eukprot:scaffold8732_cov87-Cylindrotheca_fusiformis.AAC.3